jgi:hypothetical protein
MRELNLAIQKTKKYANRYGQKLNDKQLYLRLISKNIYKIKEIKGKGVEKIEREWWNKKVVLAKKLVDENLANMCGIKMVGITGSVAAEAAKKNEDIDLMIVVERDELWWWRLYLRFYIWWNKIPHRHFGKTERMDEFCFNLWLDTDNLKIPNNKRNLKNANDLVLMKVVLNKEKTYQKFLKENAWVKKYLATGYEKRTKINRKVDEKINSKKENKSNYVKKIINRILFWGQYLYMWSKSGKKLKNIEIGQAFFHERD